MSGEDQGATPSGSGLSPSVEPASSLDGFATSIPSAGDWVLFRTSSYDPVSVDIKQASKVTASLVKFDSRHPKQCHILSVVAAFPDRATAERVRDSIGGVAGEYNRRRRIAQQDCSDRITAALTTANEQVRQIIARATGGSNV